ncbi:protein TonB [Dysgonomonas sp. PFB1-18]|uniref:energy transducer TonB n=1 Tax=unclassified Dysgonomonas TaxID=2630389 RepID=UPI002476389F|nr:MULTISPECIES: energy transducer TonB [unclassified Dysgonomonas]MDH6311046.1 protein TonB [Dysgonomonas sp. PF1-14]MDH6337895.1 protein TonB [Dysgonomonas sp. PF1-16]MDH6382594.1 protein TonB [Dysgonomonas sp. PFB1-18]MDH6398027.1 protein TonB [Dysgonomonas sp. PF1-23]
MRTFLFILSLACSANVLSQIKGFTPVENREIDIKEVKKLAPEEKKYEEKPFVSIGMPTFPGGEEALIKYVHKNLHYPEEAIKLKIEGKVVVQYAIAPNGDVANIRIKESLHPACDSAVIALIKGMPKWKPVSDKISSDFTMPIFFRLSDYEYVDGEKVYRNPTQKPSFVGGEEALYKVIMENLKWPFEEHHVGGKVVIRFIVTKDGKVKSPQVIQSVYPSLDKEALRVACLLSEWVPAKYKDKNVSAYFDLPVIFRIKE